MLRITRHPGPPPLLQLTGRLGGPWVAELERLTRDGAPRLDLGTVEYADEAGLELLARRVARGARIVRASPVLAELFEARGIPYEEGDGPRPRPGAAFRTPAAPTDSELGGGWGSTLREEADRLFRVARHLVADEEEAREVLVAAVGRAVRRPAPEGREERGARLLVAVVREALGRLRPDAEADEERLLPLLPAFDRLGFFADAAAARRLVLSGRVVGLERTCRAVLDLPTTYRVVLVLCDGEELSPFLVAEALDVEPWLVRRRLHHARLGLGALLADPEGSHVGAA